MAPRESPPPAGWTRRDAHWVRALRAELGVVRPGRPLWGVLLPALAEALRARVPVAYGLRALAQGARVSFIEGLSPAQSRLVRAHFDTALTTGSASFTAYSPLRIEVMQRNRARLLGELRGGGVTALWPQLGLARHDQLRVLVCERDSLLAWVGVYRPAEEPFTQREKALLQGITAPLRARLDLERRLEATALASAGLEACLEAMARPAALVDATAQVQFANTLARRELSRSESFHEHVRCALRGLPSEVELTALSVPGLPPHFIAIGRARDVSAQVVLMARRWRLTLREAQTVSLLSEGLSNVAIAARLGASERTIEAHVGRVLSKSECVSRAQLIARINSGGHLEKELRSPHVHP